jgi:hypothetical protein
MAALLGCKVDHLSTVFSAEEITKPWDERLCIGRQGYVRLCEHEVITWADIEAGIALEKRKPSTSPNRSIELRSCRIPGSDHEHRLGQNISGHHRATLDYSDPPTFTQLDAGLRLEWLVHFDCTVAPEMGASKPLGTKRIQAMSQVLRSKGVGSILPAEGPSHLPEMDCFSTSWRCRCLRDYMRKGAEQTTSQPGTRLPPEEIWSSAHAGMDAPCTSLHGAWTSPFTGPELMMTAWRRLPFCRKTGLEFRYKKYIGLEDDKTKVDGNDGVTLIPSHAWYHATDRSSYSWQGGCGALESCENQSCRNYYNLTAVSSHYFPDLSRKCKCELESSDSEDQGEGYDTG